MSQENMELVREQFEARNRRVLPDVTASNRLRRRLRFARKATAERTPLLTVAFHAKQDQLGRKYG
jgi:hypothetical protein